MTFMIFTYFYVHILEDSLFNKKSLYFIYGYLLQIPDTKKKFISFLMIDRCRYNRNLVVIKFRMTT